MPSTLSILINVFPPHERPRAIAIWASVTGAAGALGPIASGLLLAHFWWGSVFLINVPLILVALIGGRFFVPKSRDHEQAPLDPVGATLSTIGIVALVYGLIEAPSSGWLSGTTVGSFAAAAAVLGVFVLWELRVEHPTLDIRYFLNRAFSIGTGGMILVFLALYGVIFLLTLYFQLVLGYSALSTAVRFVPIALIMLLVTPQTPRLTARFGAHRTVGAGMLLVAAGLLALLGLGLTTSYAYVVACLVPIVGGMALSISPMTSSIMSAVPPRRAGAGSAMNDTTRELGAALGVAVLGSLAASRYASGLHDPLRVLAPAARVTAQSSLAGALQVAGSLPRAAGAALTRTADLAFVDGFHLAGVVGAVLAATSAVIVVRYLPRRLTQSDAAPMDLEELALEALMLDYPEDEPEPVVG
jgi:EmrB/QacA subfamily drug resistance transporter